ncbi:MAG: KOW domain-containing RNA-binding protein [Planctomycetota bacterium]|jgi:ribosomal protein L24
MNKVLCFACVFCLFCLISTSCAPNGQFKYGDKVNVIGGFYEGKSGTVIGEYQTSLYYHVKIITHKDKEATYTLRDKIHSSYLEKIQEAEKSL